MKPATVQSLLFLIQVVSLYFISRFAIQELFDTLRLFFKKERVVSVIMAIIFLPGTIIHELAHFLFALALLIKVKEIKIFPEFEEKKIKLGRVLYEKKDFVRGIIVGIAPIFMGLFFLWFLAAFQFFPSSSFLLNILFGYLIFVVSTTMFSSKQDLVDLIYTVPVVIILVIVFYVFRIRFEVIVGNEYAVSRALQIIRKMNLYLFFSLLINTGTIVLLRGVQFLSRR